MLHARRSLAFVLTSLCLAGGAGAFAACNDTSTPATYTPVTGVAFHLSDLLGKLQCGTGPDEVYKYTVVVWYAGTDGGPLGAPVFSDVWDCFADGVLENLPAGDGGNIAFYLKVYGYTLAGTVAAQTQGEAVFVVPSVPADAGDGGDAGPIDAGSFKYVSVPDLWCPGGLGADGSLCPLQDPSLAESFSNFASWSTSCVATETEGAPVTALCGALLPTGVSDGLDGSTGEDAPADGAPESGVDAATDAPADASDAGSDAADAAPDSPTDATSDASGDSPADASGDSPADATGEASD